MRIIVVDHDLADVTTTGYATGLIGAGPFTTFTVNTPTDGIAHAISLTSAANLSAITMTILGTDADGLSQTEALAGPNVNTVFTAAYFKTLTSITASGALGSAMDVGWGQPTCSRTVPLNRHSYNSSTFLVDVTGTAAYSVEQTFTPFNSANEFSTSGAVPKDWIAIANFPSKTADFAQSAIIGATGCRLVTTTYSSGAELQMYVQSGPGGGVGG